MLSPSPVVIATDASLRTKSPQYAALLTFCTTLLALLYPYTPGSFALAVHLVVIPRHTTLWCNVFRNTYLYASSAPRSFVPALSSNQCRCCPPFRLVIKMYDNSGAFAKSLRCSLASD